MLNKPDIHLWYLRVVIIYYLFAPAISWLMKKKERSFYTILGVIFCVTFIYNLYLICKCDSFPTTSGLSYSCYLIYLYAGYVMNKHKVHVSIAKLLGILIVSVICCVLSLLRSDYFLWYDNIFVFAASISIFGLFMNIFSKYPPRTRLSVDVTITLANMSFGIFLIHMFFLRMYIDIIPRVGNVLLFFLYYFLIMITYITSVITIYCISKICKSCSFYLFRYKQV